MKDGHLSLAAPALANHGATGRSRRGLLLGIITLFLVCRPGPSRGEDTNRLAYPFVELTNGVTDGSSTKGGWQDAIAKYTKEIQRQPKNSDNYYSRAYAYAQTGQLALALADFSEVVRLTPSAPGGYIARGSVYSLLSQWTKAIMDYTEAIRLSALDPSPYGNRGHAYFAIRQYDKAIADFTQAIQLDAERLAIYEYRGTALSAKGKFDEAIQDYTKAIALGTTNATIYASRGFAYSQQHAWQDSIKDYSQAIRLTVPSPGYLYYNVSVLLTPARQIFAAGAGLGSCKSPNLFASALLSPVANGFSKLIGTLI